MPLAMARTGCWRVHDARRNEVQGRAGHGGGLEGGGSGGWRVLLKLLEVALLDLLHHGFTAKQILSELRGDMAWHNDELISDHFRKRNRAARGNEVRAPLEHQAGVPENKASEKNGRGGE